MCPTPVTHPVAPLNTHTFQKLVCCCFKLVSLVIHLTTCVDPPCGGYVPYSHQVRRGGRARRRHSSTRSRRTWRRRRISCCARCRWVCHQRRASAGSPGRRCARTRCPSPRTARHLLRSWSQMPTERRSRQRLPRHSRRPTQRSSRLRSARRPWRNSSMIPLKLQPRSTRRVRSVSSILHAHGSHGHSAAASRCLTGWRSWQK